MQWHAASQQTLVGFAVVSWVRPQKLQEFRERIAGHERKCHSLSAVALGVDIVRTNALGSGANQQKVMLLEEKLL